MANTILLEHQTVKQVVLRYEKATFGSILKMLLCRSYNWTKSDLLYHTLDSEDKENKYLHWGIITFSHCVQYVLRLRLFSCIFRCLKWMERRLLNHNVADEKSEEYKSLLGHLDTRKELDKEINQEDGRYFAVLSMMASKLAYENRAFVKQVVSHHWKMKFEEFYNFYNEFQNTRETQAFIFCDKIIRDNSKMVIVAFRGTSPFELEDWLTDLDIAWAQILGMPGKLHVGFLKALGLKKKLGTNNVLTDPNYEGYMPKNIEEDPEKPLAYYTIRNKLKEILMEDNTKKVKFIVTGHSLGGALAILFPAILALHEEVELLDRLEAVYTFGQPRVGSRKFVDFMEEKFREHHVNYFRVVYGCDIIPTLPWDNAFMSFKHFGTWIQFNSLYQGKIVYEKSPNKEMNNDIRGNIVKKGLSFMRDKSKNYIRKVIMQPATAVWELMRGLVIGFTAGSDYKEGLLLIVSRFFGILVPVLIAHNPQDYVNSTRLASPDLFLHRRFIDN